TRMPRVLRKRFAELGRQPFRPEAANLAELPSFRELLPLLTQEQFDRLCADHYLGMKPPDWTAAQKTLYPQLVQELVDANYRRDPQGTHEVMARYKSPADYPNQHMEAHPGPGAPLHHRGGRQRPLAAGAARSGRDCRGCRGAGRHREAGTGAPTPRSGRRVRLA